MSAAEKLRALSDDVETIKEVLTEELACAALDRIAAVLPQIVAVVIAAQRQANLYDESRRGPLIRQELIPALDALDEALS